MAIRYMGKPRGTPRDALWHLFSDKVLGKDDREPVIAIEHDFSKAVVIHRDQHGASLLSVEPTLKPVAFQKSFAEGVAETRGSRPRRRELWWSHRRRRKQPDGARE